MYIYGILSNNMNSSRFTLINNIPNKSLEGHQAKKDLYSLSGRPTLTLSAVFIFYYKDNYKYISICSTDVDGSTCENG